MEYKYKGKSNKVFFDCTGKAYNVKPGEMINPKGEISHPELEEVKVNVKKQTKKNKQDEEE